MSADIEDADIAGRLTATFRLWADDYIPSQTEDGLRTALRRQARRKTTRIATLGVSSLGLVAAVLVTGQFSDGREDQSPVPGGAAHETPNTSVEPSTPPSASVGELSSGPLIGSDLAATTAPLILVGEDNWVLSYVSGMDTTAPGGFPRGISTFVGEGPRFDAPMVSALRLPPDSASADDSNVRLTIQGSDGWMTVDEADPDTKISGPILGLYWVGSDGLVNFVQSIRVPQDELIAIAETAVEDGGVLRIGPPANFSEITSMTTNDVRRVEMQFTNGDRSLQVTGENRGTDSMFGRIGGEVRTTKVINGVEIAFRPNTDSPGSYWADWMSGDWWFYAPADGLSSDQEYLDLLASLILVDADRFAAAGSDLEILMPGIHTDVVERLVEDVPVLNNVDLAAAAQLTVAQNKRDFSFNILYGVACSWAHALDSGTAERDITREALSALEIKAAAIDDVLAGQFTQLVDALDSGAEPLSSLDRSACAEWSGT